jgi:hypothetical protein
MGNQPAGNLILLTSDVINAPIAHGGVSTRTDGRFGSYWPCADSGRLTATGIACERYRLAAVKTIACTIRD